MDSTPESTPKKLYFGSLLSLFPKGGSYLRIKISASTFEISRVIHTPNGEYNFEVVERLVLYSYNPKQPISYTELAPKDQILTQNLWKVFNKVRDKILDKKVFNYLNFERVVIKFDENVPYTELLDVPIHINVFMYEIVKDFLNLRVVKESSLQTYMLSIAILKYMLEENTLVGDKYDVDDLLDLYDDKLVDKDRMINEKGILMVLNMIKNYKSFINNPSEYLEKPDLYYLAHKEEKRYPMLGKGTPILYLKDIVYPKSNPKKIDFPNQFKRFTNSYPNFSLNIRGDNFDNYESDGKAVELYLEWTSRLAFKTVKYNLLTGETTSKCKDINYILPRLARYLIQEVFLTGNYIYLNNICLDSETFSFRCYDGEYLGTSTAKSPHHIIDLLSTIYSKGVDLKFIHTYRSFIFIVFGVYNVFKDRITIVDKYIKDEGFYTNGDCLAKLYSK